MEYPNILYNVFMDPKINFKMCMSKGINTFWILYFGIYFQNAHFKMHFLIMGIHFMHSIMYY